MSTPTTQPAKLREQALALADAAQRTANAVRGATEARSAAESALVNERAKKLKTRPARVAQGERVNGLRLALRAAKAAHGKAVREHRKAARAMERGPKAFLLSVDESRARHAGAHLDMTGKDACIIPSWEESHLVREAAHHVWKNSGSECYWSKGRSKDIEYVRATRDNHIASWCVIRGKRVYGLLHTTEWCLSAPAGMSWSVRDAVLRISPPPSKLVSPVERTVYAPELPSVSGMRLAEQAYDDAYRALRDRQARHGPKVRAAVRTLSRRLALGWKVGVEDLQGRQTAFAARRDGEKYHFRSSDVIYSPAGVRGVVDCAIGAFARRDAIKIREAQEALDKIESARIAEIASREIGTTRVTMEDSRRAGNCVEGTLAFAEKKLHISREEIIAGSYLFTVPAGRVLAAANGDKAAAERAVRAAFARETMVSI